MVPTEEYLKENEIMSSKHTTETIGMANVHAVWDVVTLVGRGAAGRAISRGREGARAVVVVNEHAGQLRVARVLHERFGRE